MERSLFYLYAWVAPDSTNGDQLYLRFNSMGEGLTKENNFDDMVIIFYDRVKSAPD